MAGQCVRIISIETTGMSCSVALHEDRLKRAECFTYGSGLHDKLASEFVRRIMADLELGFEDISAVAVSSGPGSFTGLRIGGSIAKGLCFADSPRLIAVPTLSAIAYSAVRPAGAMNKKKIIPVIDSYRENYYWQEFDPAGSPCGEINCTGIESLRMAASGALLCGPGAIDDPAHSGVLATLSAGQTGALAFELYNRGIFTPAAEYTPLYLQDFTPKTAMKHLNI